MGLESPPSGPSLFPPALSRYTRNFGAKTLFPQTLFTSSRHYINLNCTTEYISESTSQQRGDAMFSQGTAKSPPKKLSSIIHRQVEKKIAVVHFTTMPSLSGAKRKCSFYFTILVPVPIEL